MPLLKVSPEAHLIDDQAFELRRLIAKQSFSKTTPSSEPLRNCRSLAVFSGKGGVGKSIVAFNLAMALARRGASVCLVDATPNVSNLGLLCGQNGYWNLAHVLAGTRTLDDILLSGPSGIQIVPGAVHLIQDSRTRSSVIRSLNEFERRFDWLIVDTGADVWRHAPQFIQAADCALVITTPEPAAVTEAYAALKSVAVGGLKSIVSLLINQADSEQQATDLLNRLRQAARTFLGSDAAMAGFVPFDEAIRQSVARREPLSANEPNSIAQLALDRVAEHLSRTVSFHRDMGFFEHLETSLAES